MRRTGKTLRLSRSQTLVYVHGERDIAVDTTSTDPQECARTIVNALAAVLSPRRSIGSATVGEAELRGVKTRLSWRERAHSR